MWCLRTAGCSAVPTSGPQPFRAQAVLHLQPQRLKQRSSPAVRHSRRAAAGLGRAGQPAVLQAHLRGSQQPAAADSAQCVKGAGGVAVGVEQEAAGCSVSGTSGE